MILVRFVELIIRSCSTPGHCVNRLIHYIYDNLHSELVMSFLNAHVNATRRGSTENGMPER